MAQQNQSGLAARLGDSAASTISSSTDATQQRRSSSCSRLGGHQAPIIDLLVTMIAVPILILCALQLEKNLHDMASSPESRWLVFALGVGMLVVSVIICGYVTHRMGVCLWAGPIDEAGNRIHGRGGVSHINSQNDILRIVDTLPPSYDSVVKFDIPPPPYDCIIIDMEQCKEDEDDEADEDENAARAQPQAQPSGSKEQQLPDTSTTLHI